MPPRNIRKHSIAEKWFFKQASCKYPAILLIQYFLDRVIRVFTVLWSKLGYVNGVECHSEANRTDEVELFTRGLGRM